MQIKYKKYRNLYLFSLHNHRFHAIIIKSNPYAGEIMEYTKLFFVCHGQSDGNLKKLCYGQNPGMLTELGHRQAEAVADYLSNVRFDCIYSSDQRRAYETAEPTADRQKLHIISDPGLREINSGKWECMSWSDIETNYPEEFELWIRSFSKAGCPDGESIGELYERISKHVRQLAKEHIGETVAVFTHAAALRSLGCDWAGLGLEYTDTENWFENASISEVDYYEDGSINPVSVGFTGHLKALSSVSEA